MSEPVVLGPLPERPLFSLLSTVYQHERFLERALDSVLAQDWPLDQLEYVIVNDGSTDRSAEILDRYAAEYPFMRVIHQENGGLKAALNRGMAELSGDLIRLLSGDDMLTPHSLSAAAQFMTAYPATGLLYSDMTVIGAHDEVTYDSFMRSAGLTAYIGRPVPQLLQKNFVSGGAMTMRGELRDRVYPMHPDSAWEDYWTAWCVAQVADLAYLDISTYMYRQHDANMSLGARGEKMAMAYREEGQFRRYMLRTIEPGKASGRELLVAIVALAKLGKTVIHHTGMPPLEVYPVTEEQAREAARHEQLAAQALARGDLEEASLHAAYATGNDPHRDTVHHLVHELSKVLPEDKPVPTYDDAVQAAHAAAPDPPANPLDEARSFVALVDADDLLATPALLGTYAEAIGEADDATLVIHAAGWSPERAGSELGALLERFGIAGDDAPDVLAHLGPASDRDVLLPGVHAVLSEPGDPGTGDHRFGTDDAAALRAHAERHWVRQAA